VRFSTILGATVIALAVLVTGPAVQSQTVTQEMELASRARIALFADERVKETQVSVETRDGVITLRGKVDSDEAKAAASSIASGIAGVTRVRNDLQVVSPDRRTSVGVNDDEITRRVEDGLAQDARLDRVNVRTDAGVVTLTGKVSTIGAGVHASLIACELSGVRSVNNELIYAPAVGAHDGSAVPSPGRVMAMQQALRDRGYDPGTIDGILGHKTASALRRYQQLENLSATGRMDAETAAKLRSEDHDAKR
jgi:osmotically-inducible protein OsmY